MGVAQAYAATAALKLVIILGVGRALIGFTLSLAVKQLLAFSGACILACFAIPLFMRDNAAIFAGSLVIVTGCVVCLWGLADRLGARTLPSNGSLFFKSTP